VEREISSLLRKVIKEIVSKFGENQNIGNGKGETEEIRQALKDNPKFKKSMQKSKTIISAKDVEKYLKAPKFKDKKDELSDKTGVVTGLAWTSVGGDILPIEVAIINGPERLILTGKLGEVMKESARAALTFVRAYSEELGLPEGFYKKKEIHIHVPEGAIPKDGPSAGITMCMALISAFSGKDARGDIAMTGEITLRGNILPIGGLNEKLLAAKRHNIKTVLVPYDNKRDVEDINPIITQDLEIFFIKHAKEAMPHVFKDYKVAKKPSKAKKEVKPEISDNK
jgi:ATP-dependent Lon protease